MTKGAPGWVMAAPASNSGKTLVSAALSRLLSSRGRTVQPFKVGPDYIDPGFLAAGARQECVNLDPWGMGPARQQRLLSGCEADLFLVEGVMGLFDGAVSGDGSTADLAAMFGLPVILVIDSGGQSTSVAALAQGFANFRTDVNVAGVIFTKVGSPRHRLLLSDACEGVGIRVFGSLANDPGLVLRERHLGLVQASERDDLDDLLDRAAEVLAQDIDLKGLEEVAASPHAEVTDTSEPMPPIGQHISVARDVAFGFCYPHVLQDWRTAGAEIGFFSPLVDETPAAAADAVYLPGGYPELHAAALSNNRQFLSGLQDAATRGATIFGECGGYMVLGDGVVDSDGQRHEMAGLLPLETDFEKRKLHLGYRQVCLMSDCALGPAGRHFRGHEFHYASVTSEQGEPLFTVWDALGQHETQVGTRTGNVMGSFVHLIDRDCK